MRSLREHTARLDVYGLWALRAVWASCLLLGCSTALADGTFCWRELPQATSYRLYWATVAYVDDPLSLDPADVQAAPPAWRTCDYMEFTRDNCAAGTCCVFVVDRPGTLVYYFATAHDSGTPPRASLPPVPSEPCP